MKIKQLFFLINIFLFINLLNAQGQNYSKQKCYNAAINFSTSFKIVETLTDNSNLGMTRVFLDNSLINMLQAVIFCDSAIKYADSNDTIGKYYAFRAVNLGLRSIKYTREARIEENEEMKAAFYKRAKINIANSTNYCYLAAQNFNGRLTSSQQDQVITKVNDKQNEIKTIQVEKQKAVISQDSLINKINNVNGKLAQFNDIKNYNKVQLEEIRVLRTQKNLLEFEISEIASIIEEFVSREEFESSKNSLISKGALNDVKKSEDNSNKNMDKELVTNVKNSTLISNSDNTNSSISDSLNNITKLKNTPMFYTTDTSVVNENSQTGLLYKIQVGTYSNRINTDRFNGLTPVLEKMYNDKYVYIVGNFKTYINAKEAKEYVIKLGFDDAFIKAFYNEEVITIQEAIEFEK